MKLILAITVTFVIFVQLSFLYARKLGGTIGFGHPPYGDYLSGRLPLINPRLALAPYATPFNYLPVFGGRFKGVFGDDDYHYAGYLGSAAGPPVQLTTIHGQACLNCMNRATLQASQCISPFCIERTRFDLEKCMATCGTFR